MPLPTISSSSTGPILADLLSSLLFGLSPMQKYSPLPKNQLILSNTGIQYPLCNPDTLLTVHIQCSVCDPYFIPRSCHDSLNIIMGILIAIRQKCHNISCLGGRQDIGKTVNVDLLSVLQCRFHGHTHHSCRPAEEDHYNSGEKHRQRNAEDPAEYLPQKCLTNLFFFCKNLVLYFSMLCPILLSKFTSHSVPYPGCFFKYKRQLF